MKKRIISNWRTSLLGFILLATSVSLLYLRIMSGGEFIALLPTILGLLYLPDEVLRKTIK